MKQLTKNKKGQMGNQVLTSALSIGGAVMVIAVLAIVLGAFRDSTTANTYEYNISNRGLTFLDNATSKFGTAGTIVGVLVLLGLVAGIGYFGYNKIRG